MVHVVHLYDKSSWKCIWIYASNVKTGQKIFGEIRVKILNEASLAIVQAVHWMTMDLSDYVSTDFLCLSCSHALKAGGFMAWLVMQLYINPKYSEKNMFKANSIKADLDQTISEGLPYNYHLLHTSSHCKLDLFKQWDQYHEELTLFSPVTTNVVCYFICWCTLVVYIANTMVPDLSVLSVCFHDKSSLDYIWNFAASIISIQHF